jgi:deoxycytidine triphosphate deaminase
MHEEISGPTGGMLSSADFRKRIIKQDIPQMKEYFRQRKWKKLPNERSFILDPFDPLNLTPFSYDLSVGNEAFSCRSESRGSFSIKENKENAYWIQPGETVVVRTVEYIALPRWYSATVWPRFDFVREGIFQSMVKIDPTWYGQLGVALTNLSPAGYPIWQGKQFATLILFELVEKADIILYKKDEILEEDDKIEISLDGVEKNITEKNLKIKGLEGKYKIENNKLIINVALTLEDFKNLRSLDESERWKEEVNKAIRIKTADALGLPNLDILLGKKSDGIRLKREKVGVSACTEEALLTAAVERGRPFDLLAELPNFIVEKVERDISPRLRAEVEASLFPKTITLTLTVLGFLSLIVAILAIVTDKYKLSEVSWPGAVSIGLIGLGLIILAVLVSKIVHKLSSRSPDSRVIKQLKKGIEDLRKEVQSKRNHT